MKHARDSAEFVRMLLDAGSDVNTTNHAGKTPLDMALEGAEGGEEKRGAYRRIADLLRRNGARRAAEL